MGVVSVWGPLIRDVSGGGVLARAQEAEELDALAQPALHHLGARDHLGEDRGDLRRTEIKFLVEILDRLEDLRMAQMGVVERRDLSAFLCQKIDLLVVQPAVLLRLAVKEGAGIWRRERDLNRMRIDLLRKS